MRSVAGVLCALALLGPARAARADVPPCAEPVPVEFTGVTGTASCASDALGGVTSFSYYVPPECSAENRCPTLYLLHGFGGDETSMLKPGANTGVYERALRQDPITGADLPDLSFFLIAPRGRTVAATAAGAPPPGQESFWVDWNPRYWSNPPRFEEFVTRELVSLVDKSFPTIASRDGRAILGVSLGGFGSYKLAFQHPDLYASAASISGALNILVAPAVQPIGPGPNRRGGAPAETTYVHGPRVLQTPTGFPFGDPFGAFGDTVTDEAYYRGNNPLDLTVNGTGLGLRFFHNDTIPRDAADFANPGSYIGAQALEDVVLPMNLEMRAALTQHGIPHEYELHPGLHSGRYWDPYVRAQLEWHYARASHPGAPLAPEPPASFVYRSIRRDFSVWGWDVHVERTPEEFLTLYATTKGIRVTGSGAVTITTPPLQIPIQFYESGDENGVSVSFHRLSDGRYRLMFDLGPSGATDEHGGSSSIPGASHTFTFCFETAEDTSSC